MRISLAGECFISYEGIASNGHWDPDIDTADENLHANAEDAQGVIGEFRVATAPAASLSARTHEMIVGFDLDACKRFGQEVYDGTGYFPQLGWVALERSGIWSAMNELTDGSEPTRLRQWGDRAGLILPNSLFRKATELVAEGQEIDWNHRTDVCGGHNLLFLYAGNVVSRMYPSYPRRDELLLESFVFNPALVERA